MAQDAEEAHEGLLGLRNDNAHRERRFYAASADKEIVKEPVYDVKAPMGKPDGRAVLSVLLSAHVKIDETPTVLKTDAG